MCVFMCVSVYMCLCVHVYVHNCIFMCVSVYISVSLCMCLSVCKYICMCVYMCVSKCVSLLSIGEVKVFFKGQHFFLLSQPREVSPLQLEAA